MKLDLPRLPYEINELEPYISARTLDVHYRYKQFDYIAKLSNILPGTIFENADLKRMVIQADGKIYYYANQIWNHNFYFTSIHSPKEYIIHEPFSLAIKYNYNSFKGFREQFTKSATSIFGSGWAWVIVNECGKLEIIQVKDTENPLRKGIKPILTIDLCEHAFCMDYKYRADYINSFWNVINWNIIEKRFCHIYSNSEIACY